MRTRSSAKMVQSPSIDPDFDEQKKLALPELGEVISLNDEPWIRSLYHHLTTESAIDAFLRKSHSYSLAKRRWKLPRSYSKLLNDDLHTPFLKILSSILAHFWNDPSIRGTRVVMDTHETSLPHREARSTTHSSRPSFVIKADGPSFERPHCEAGQVPTEVGFSNVATCIDLQIEGADIPIDEQLARLVIYARQIFIQQPNRRFVRLMGLSKDHFRLFHFDRSGVQYTPNINLHDDPHTFVRLVLGLSSPNEVDIGLDSSIQWTIENGRKVGGTLRSRGADGTELVYPLSKVTPLFFRGVIRGRSTICWSVFEPSTGENLVVKDSWRSEDVVSEHLFLQDAVGTPGIVQMVSCEPGRDETRKLRGFGNALPLGFRNRVETRVVMKAYGKSLENFTSAMQLLCALRDAIAGHMELYSEKGILHRDLSIHNILLGVPGADPGYRGVLIDFDMAIRYLEGSRKPENWIIGTRHFQSIAVLSSGEYDHDDPWPRDHLDDLESFFYVLAHIFWVYDPQGNFLSIPHRVSGWDDKDALLVATRKEAFLSWKSPPVPMRKRWPIPCLNLLLSFQAFLYPLVLKKMNFNRDPDEMTDEIQASLNNVVQHYAHVLQLFDEAIEALDQPPESWKLVCHSRLQTRCEDLIPSALEAQTKGDDVNLKRCAGEYPDGQPLRKRSV